MDTNTRPPLRFHYIHGKNIVLQKDQRLARRTAGFYHGVTFSNRPIYLNEKVHIQVIEVSRSRREGLRFGVTIVDPEYYRRCPVPLSAFAMNKPGFWVRDLPTVCLGERTVVQISADPLGCFNYKVLGEFDVILSSGCLFRGIDISRPIWMIFDIYGNTVALEFIDRARSMTAARSPLPRPAPARTAPRSPLPRPIAPPSFALEPPTIRERSSSATSTRTVTFSNAGLPSQIGMTRRESAPLSERTSQQNQLTENDRAPARTGPRSPLPRPFAVLTFAWEAPRTRVTSSSTSSTRAMTSSNAGLPSQIGMTRRESAPLSERTSQQNQLTENEPSGILLRTGSRSTQSRCTPVRNARHSSVPPAPERSTPRASIRRSPGSLYDFQEYDVDVCKVCFDAKVDTALYKCGHVCMCEDCAKEVLRRPGVCPICREVIIDIIKIFRA